MAVSVRLLNKERFYQKLRAVVPRIDEGLEKVNKESASEMVSMARRLAPHEDGVLQASIRFSRGPSSTGYTVQAGGETTTIAVRAGQDAEYDYALGQEFGTRKMQANPFFWPAYRVVRKTHKGRATRALRKAIKQAGF